MDDGSTRPLMPGERAPHFSLPAIDREGTVSLDDYVGRQPLLLALFLGLWCPFCRKQIAGLARSAQRLRERGVETLGVVATSPENARLYFRFRPAAMPMAADPELVTHRLYRLPVFEVTPEYEAHAKALKVNPTGELPDPVSLWEIGGHLDRLHGFERSGTDQVDMERQYGLVRGQFLLDRDGVVRWANIECAREGLPGVGKFPTEEELLEAARLLES